MKNIKINKFIPIIYFMMVFTLFLFLVSVNINKKIVKTQNDLLKIDEISSNLSSLEHNSANLTRAIIVTGLYEKEEEYNKMIKEINHIIMEVQIKEVDLEILKNLKELSSLNELISEIEVNSIKESKENNVIKGPKTVDNINYVYYRSLYSKTLTFTINIMKTKKMDTSIKLTRILDKLNTLRFIINFILLIYILLLLKKVDKQDTDKENLLMEIADNNNQLEIRIAERTREVEEQNRSIKMKVEEAEELSNELVDKVKELEEMQKALKDSRNLLDTMISNVPSALFIKDRQGKLLLRNNAFSKMLGIKEDNLMKEYESNSSIKELLEKLFEIEERVMIEKIPLTFEYFITSTINSSVHYLHISEVPLINEMGECFGLCGSVTDFTDLKFSEQKVIVEKERLKTILDVAPVGVAISVNNIIKFVNSSISDLINFKVGEFSGNAYVHLFERERMLEELKENGYVKNYEIDMYNSKNEIRKTLATVQRIEYEGEAGYLGWFIDITDIKNSELAMKKSMELAEESTRIKSEFLANMSHEIRTPMNAIIGLTHLLEKTNLNDKQKDYAIKVNNSAKNLLGIINDILDFSKIEANKMALEFVEFDLENVLEDIANINGVRASEKNLEFIIAKDTRIPSKLKGDSLRLSQVLNNLVSNAIKFTEKGEVLLKISIEELDNRNVKLYFSVKDTGIGMTEEQMSRLFNAFSQGDNSTTRKYGGTGLGLIISKRIVDVMGGILQMNSIFRQGSEFYFSANFELGNNESERNLEFLEKVKDMNTLVVDDNSTSRAIIKNYLESFGMKVEEANSGEKAIEILNDKFEFVVLDSKMTGMNGLETWKKIKEKYPNTLPKVLLLINYGFENIHNEASLFGINNILHKPISNLALYEEIIRIFNLEAQIEGIQVKDRTLLNEIRGSRILLVEDSKINQQIAKENLESEGFFVDIADNGKNAIEILSENEYDLILMDLQMPILDGYDATIEIRKNEKFMDLPIVALSADAMVGTKEKVIKIGMNDYLSKPIDIVELFNILIKWIKPRKRERIEIKNTTREENSESINSLSIKLRNFNVKQALPRVSEKIPVYIELLKKFEITYKNFIPELQYLFEKLDWKTIKLRLHTLKSVSGNIGNMKISNLAGILEKESDNMQNLIELKEWEELSYSISEAISEIQTVAENKMIMTEEILSNVDLEKELRELTELLENYSANSHDKFKILYGTLINLGFSKEVTQIEKNIKEYKFQKAKELCIITLGTLKK